MTRLRPECGTGTGIPLPDHTALYLIRDSVAKRRSLIHGRLHNATGQHCAVGAFWADHPKMTLSSALVDEVAAVNDSVPPTATPQQRWKKVMGWLRWRVKVLSAQGR